MRDAILFLQKQNCLQSDDSQLEGSGTEQRRGKQEAVSFFYSAQPPYFLHRTTKSVENMPSNDSHFRFFLPLKVPTQSPFNFEMEYGNHSQQKVRNISFISPRCCKIIIHKVVKTTLMNLWDTPRIPVFREIGRQFECVSVLYFDLRWTGDRQVSASSFPEGLAPIVGPWRTEGSHDFGETRTKNARFGVHTIVRTSSDCANTR